MKKRMLAAILSLVMIIATVSGVSFAAGTTGGNVVTTGSVTDECVDFANVYSISNVQVSEQNWLDQFLAKDMTAWRLTDGASAAEIVYKAGADAEFSGINAEIVRWDAAFLPVVSYSTDGVTYTNLYEPMTAAAYEGAGWKEQDHASTHTENTYRRRCILSGSFPVGTKYVKISVQAGALKNNDFRKLFFNQIKLTGNAHNVLLGTTTDDCENFDKVYSKNNLRLPDADYISVLGFKDPTLWQVTDVTKEAEVVYKAAENVDLTNVFVEIAKWNNIKYPVVSYSADGVTYTNIKEPMEAVGATADGWTYINSACNDSTYGRLRYSLTSELPVGTKYLKFTVQANSMDRDDRFYFSKIDIAGVVRNVLTGSVNDTCADFNNVYSTSNIQVAPTSEMTGISAKDETAWKLIDAEKATEVVYKADTNVEMSSIHIEMVRWDNILFPVISYSENGITYTNLNTPMTEAAGVGADWVYKDNASEGVNYYRMRYTFDGSFPIGTKYVKISVQPNATKDNREDKLYFNAVNITTVNRGTIGSNETDDFADFSKTYDVKNITQVSDLTMQEDTSFWKVTDTTKAAEILYKAADGFAFSEVSLEISRNQGLKYPVISYSKDGVTFTDITVRSNELRGDYLDDETVAQDWKRIHNAGDSNLWQWGYSTTKTVPKGAKYIKIEILDNASPKAFYLRKASFKLESQPELTLSVDENGVGTVTVGKAGTGMAKLVIAEYDFDDRLTGVISKDIDLSKTGIQSETLPFSADGFYFKAFLFDSLSTFVPLLETASYL